MTDSKTSTTGTATARTSAKVWTDEERAAMQEGARERKTASRRAPRDERAEGEQDLLAKVAQMPDHDRIMAERIHALVMGSAPSLMPKTYYGMPAYARDGKVVCFFKAASKFKERYATFGFEGAAHLDNGAMWPVAFALIELTPADEATIAELVKQATG